MDEVNLARERLKLEQGTAEDQHLVSVTNQLLLSKQIDMPAAEKRASIAVTAQRSSVAFTIRAGSLHPLCLAAA